MNTINKNKRHCAKMPDITGWQETAAIQSNVKQIISSLVLNLHIYLSIYLFIVEMPRVLFYFYLYAWPFSTPTDTSR